MYGKHVLFPDWVLFRWPVAQCSFIVESTMGHVSGKSDLTYNRYSVMRSVSLLCRMHSNRGSPNSHHCSETSEPPNMVTVAWVLMSGGARRAVVLGLPPPQP